jgi:hypothetical protein
VIEAIQDRDQRELGVGEVRLDFEPIARRHAVILLGETVVRGDMRPGRRNRLENRHRPRADVENVGVRVVDGTQMEEPFVKRLAGPAGRRNRFEPPHRRLQFAGLRLGCGTSEECSGAGRVIAVLSRVKT